MTNLAQARRPLRDELHAAGLCDRLQLGVRPERNQYRPDVVPHRRLSESETYRDDLGRDTVGQKREHLPKICRGEIRWCQGYSEPDSGSDLASVKTKAERGSSSSARSKARRALSVCPMA